MRTGNPRGAELLQQSRGQEIAAKWRTDLAEPELGQLVSNELEVCRRTWGAMNISHRQGAWTLFGYLARFCMKLFDAAHQLAGAGRTECYPALQSNRACVSGLSEQDYLVYLDGVSGVYPCFPEDDAVRRSCCGEAFANRGVTTPSPASQRLPRGADRH